MGELRSGGGELFVGREVVVVRSATDDRVFGEIVRVRRRRGLPLEARRAPRVARRFRPLEPGVEQVEEHDGEARAEDERADAAEAVQRAEALEVVPVAA